MILQISKLNVAMMPVVKVLAVAETQREVDLTMFIAWHKRQTDSRETTTEAKIVYF